MSFKIVDNVNQPKDTTPNSSPVDNKPKSSTLSSFSVLGKKIITTLSAFGNAIAKKVNALFAKMQWLGEALTGRAHVIQPKHSQKTSPDGSIASTANKVATNVSVVSLKVNHPSPLLSPLALDIDPFQPISSDQEIQPIANPIPFATPHKIQRDEGSFISLSDPKEILIESMEVSVPNVELLASRITRVKKSISDLMFKNKQILTTLKAYVNPIAFSNPTENMERAYFLSIGSQLKTINQFLDQVDKLDPACYLENLENIQRPLILLNVVHPVWIPTVHNEKLEENIKALTSIITELK